MKTMEKTHARAAGAYSWFLIFFFFFYIICKRVTIALTLRYYRVGV